MMNFNSNIKGECYR